MRRSAVTFMAHQAWLMGDAIVRTLVRLFVTRRHLLEWVPAAQATIGPRLDLLGFYRVMVSGVGFGVGALLVALLTRHGTWLMAHGTAARAPGRSALAAGGAARRAVDCLAGDRALDQPATVPRRHGRPFRRPTRTRCG